MSMLYNLQSIWISHCFTVLHHFHIKEKILSEDECKDIGSAGSDWEWKLVSHLSAKSLGCTQEVVKFLEEAEFDSDCLEPLKILQHFYHKENILSEDECKDIGSAGRNWEWKLVSHLSAKSLGYTQEVVKFLEEAKFASYYLKPLKFLHHFHHEDKVLSEEECKDIALAGILHWERKLVSHLFLKPFKNIQETVQFLKKERFRSNYLQCLKILHHFHHEDKVLSEEECKDIALARGDWERKLVSHLSVKQIEKIQETVQFLEREWFGSDYLQCLKILHHFHHEDKVLSEEECKDIALAGILDWKRKLESHLSVKPFKNIQETVKFLKKERFYSSFWPCLKILHHFHHEDKVLSEEECKDIALAGILDWKRKLESHLFLKRFKNIQETVQFLKKERFYSSFWPCLKILHHFHHEDKVLSEEECKDIALARGDWERKLVSHLSVKQIEKIQETVQFLEKERFDSDYLQCLKILSKVLLQSKDLQLSGALVDMTSKGYLNRLQILQKLPDHLCFSLVVAEIVCLNKFRFKQYHDIHEESVLLQKLKVVLREVEKYTENTTARGHFTDRLEDYYYRYFYGPISYCVASAYQDILDGSYELGKRLGEIIEMFWEDQLKEEEFKRILKDKDFSAIQHAKQAARSRIYQPRPATATFRTHGYTTSLSTPHLQTKSSSILSPEEYDDTIFGTEQLKSPKSIESMKSKFMDSVATFSEKQKLLQKSYLVSGSESMDPEEPDDPSPHELEHEEQLDQLCWIPFGIQSLQVDHTGGRFSLEPDGDRPVESDVTHLEVPEGAVAEKRKVQIRYGIIMDGPLVAPDGYKLASPVVYIYYNSEDIKSPITLHLPHWSADADKVKMMMAPHSPVNDKFTFGDYKGADNGRDFLLTGHCTLFTEASSLDDPSVYYAFAWKCKSVIKTRITATYKHNVWIKILQEYWKDFYNVEQHCKFKFLEDQDSLKCTLKPDCHGTFSGCSQIKKEDIEYETGKIHVLEDNVKLESYPLFLTLVPNIGSKSKDPPYENVSLQGIDTSITFHCDLHKGSSFKEGSAAKLDPEVKEQQVIEKSPQEIINFLDQQNEKYIKFCNAKAVCTDLECEHVISAGQRQQLGSSQSVAESNCLFYQFLRDDPVPETLKGAAKVLKNASGTTNTNKLFATSIETFLQSC